MPSDFLGLFARELLLAKPGKKKTPPLGGGLGGGGVFFI